MNTKRRVDKYPDIEFLSCDKEWLTPREGAKFTNFSQTTFRKYEKEDPGFPPRKLFSKRKFFYSAALLKTWYENKGSENND